MRGTFYLREWEKEHYINWINSNIDKLFTNNERCWDLTAENLSPANLLEILKLLEWNKVDEEEVGNYTYCFYFQKEGRTLKVCVEALSGCLYIEREED